MKFCIIVLSLLMVVSSFAQPNPECYSPEYVQISEVQYEDAIFQTVIMRRDGERVKAKYFAAQDKNGNSVYNRFLQWQRTKPQIILFSNGTFVDYAGNPQGLTIDNGTMVNQNLICGRMDALVIVYASGGIAVSDLKIGDLSVKGIPRKLDLCNNGNDLDDFIEWAKREEATVFQTQLLIYKNQIKSDQRTASNEIRDRKFLAVCKDDSGKYVHVMIQIPTHLSIYESVRKTLEFLQESKKMEVIFTIYFDPGGQDVFQVYNPDCSVNQTFRGALKPQNASNLLVYYFE